MTRTKSTYLALLAVLLSPMAANADPIIGDLTDGSLQFGNITGEWALSAIAGDVITVTMRRLSDFDALAWIGFGSDASFCQGEFSNCVHGVDFGDDNLPNIFGGTRGFGDPQFTFTAQNTGRYTIGAVDCCFTNANGYGDQYTYSIQAVGSTFASVPEPGTLTLLGIGLFGMGLARRRRKV